MIIASLLRKILKTYVIFCREIIGSIMKAYRNNCSKLKYNFTTYFNKDHFAYSNYILVHVSYFLKYCMFKSQFSIENLKLVTENCLSCWAIVFTIARLREIFYEKSTYVSLSAHVSWENLNLTNYSSNNKSNGKNSVESVHHRKISVWWDFRGFKVFFLFAF